MGKTQAFAHWISYIETRSETINSVNESILILLNKTQISITHSHARPVRLIVWAGSAQRARFPVEQSFEDSDRRFAAFWLCFRSKFKVGSDVLAGCSSTIDGWIVIVRECLARGSGRLRLRLRNDHLLVLIMDYSLQNSFHLEMQLGISMETFAWNLRENKMIENKFAETHGPVYYLNRLDFSLFGNSVLWQNFDLFVQRIQTHSTNRVKTEINYFVLSVNQSRRCKQDPKIVSYRITFIYSKTCVNGMEYKWDTRIIKVAIQYKNTLFMHAMPTAKPTQPTTMCVNRVYNM